ncbi:ATP-binding protein, partial [Hansschlegelia zhihuaiae]
AGAGSRLGLAVFELRPPRLDGAALSLVMTRVTRAAQLNGFAVLVDAARIRRLAGGGNRDAAEDALAAVMAGLDCSAVALEEEPRDAAPGWRPILVAPPGDGERLEIWRAVAPEGAALNEGALAELAAQFPLGPAEIAEVASASPAFRPQELWAAARERCRASTEGLGDIVIPRYGWDDIVLPSDALDDLRAIAAQARHRALVYNQWGFGARLVRNSGVTALFAGPSGVGKTMAAEVICQDLGVDLLRIDLSGVISKYIGETEKNLKRVFDGAQRSGAALFFDEADALFGKRSEVKDSHDRYANIEVSYLLQRMEAFSGLAILATNMKAHLDQAFLRRLRYVVDLPFPTGDLRREIWRRAFPAAAPTEALDLDMLARLEIAGGNIVVIAVNAAFHAAAEGRPIAMAHVLRAARSEFRKLDRELRLPLGMEARHGR